MQQHYGHRRCRCRRVRLFYDLDPRLNLLEGEASIQQLAIQSINYSIKAHNSILTSELDIVYLNLREDFDDIKIEDVELINIKNALGDKGMQELGLQQNQKEEGKNMEINFEMSTNYDQVISTLKIIMGDKEINAQVQDIQKAKERYEDAVAAGHTAGLMTYKEDDPNTLRLSLGNVKYGQLIQVKVVFIEQALTLNGAYEIRIPYDLMLLMFERREQSRLDIDIQTTKNITNLYCPSYLKKTQDDQNQNHTTISCNLQDIKKVEQISIFYTLNDQDEPQILQQTSEDLQKTTLMIQVMPTFSPEPQEAKIQVQYDEIPQETVVDVNRFSQKTLAIFIVDRSGSMEGQKMQITNQSLMLFLQSLPSDNSMFQILSFGTNYSNLHSDSKKDEALAYNQENLDFALKKVEKFKASKGGTNIFKPLKAAFDMKSPDDTYEKVIFLLTDGQTEDPYKCRELIQNMPKNTQIHCFGVGYSCDMRLLQQLTSKGKGKLISINESQMHLLRQKVIEVLSQSIQPSFRDFKTNIFAPVDPIVESCNLKQGEYETLYRNSLFTQFYVFDKQAFDKIKDEDLKYHLSYNDPATQRRITIEIDKRLFNQIENGNTLQKMAAHYKIKSLEENDSLAQNNLIVKLSTDYQVLSKHTGMIGIIKNQDKVLETVEMKKVTVSGLAPQQNYLDRDRERNYLQLQTDLNASHLMGSRGGRGGRGGYAHDISIRSRKMDNIVYKRMDQSLQQNMAQLSQVNHQQLGVGGLSYLSKKSWHAGSFQNIEQVWQKEQYQRNSNLILSSNLDNARQRSRSRSLERNRQNVDQYIGKAASSDEQDEFDDEDMDENSSKQEELKQNLSKSKTSTKITATKCKERSRVPSQPEMAKKKRSAADSSYFTHQFQQLGVIM
eukprot:403335667